MSYLALMTEQTVVYDIGQATVAGEKPSHDRRTLLFRPSKKATIAGKLSDLA